MGEMNKKDIIQLLEKIAVYMELKGENSFRISAYRKAAQGLERDVRSLKQINDFTKVPGIGKGTNDLIIEYIETGISTTLSKLEKEVPRDLIPLLKLPGLGGKRLAVLYQELQITDSDTLKVALEAGEVEKIKGFGKKTAANLLQALTEQGQRPERLPVYDMLKVADQVEEILQTIPEISRYSLAGSLRRLEETIKDVDFILVATDRLKVRKALIDMPAVKEVIANGDTKVSVIVEAGYDVNIDFRLVEAAEFATALHHFTGSKDHNVRMRQLAKRRQEKINEYGVEVEGTGKILQFDTEEAFFTHFDLHYIPPEMREDTGEVEDFKNPVSVLERSDIRGDLHMHTTWSDGAQSIEEMVQAARELNYEYIAITDHSKYLRVANGLSETRLRKQREEIASLNDRYDDIHIFAGVEMDILPNGELDFSNDFLQEMDLVIAAIHSGFEQSETDIMKRLYHALENPYVDIIAHPTGRIIGRRKGYQANVEQLIEKAAATNTALELNANPQRFDLATPWLMKAQEANVPIAINTDAHNIASLAYMDAGVRMGKKAWLHKASVMNTWNKDDIIKFIQRGKK